MISRLTKLPGFNRAPGASATLIAKLQAGMTYLRLIIRCRDAAGPRTEAELRTDIDLIKLTVNGRTKWELTAAELIDLCMRFWTDNRCAADYMQDLGILVIDLAPTWLTDQMLAMDLGLGMAGPTPDGKPGVSEAQLEVTLSAGGGITRADVFAEVIDEIAPAGLIRCVRRSAKSWAATGEEADDSFVIRPSNALIALHHTLGTAPGVVDVDLGIDAVLNGKSIYQMSDDQMRILVRSACLQPHASWVHFVFALRNQYADAIAGGGRAAIPTLGIPAQLPVASFVRKTFWSTAPAGYVQVADTAEPALAD